MRGHLLSVALILIGHTFVAVSASDAEHRDLVVKTPGLIAFWDFIHADQEGRWISSSDPQIVTKPYPMVLRQIGDAKSYRPDEWPYTDAESRLNITAEGPFGRAVRFNQGFVFAEVPRSAFDGTPLDITGAQSLTLLSWIKFTGKRHLVAGIWDEGGWDPYGGRRQIAIFGGLFGSKGVISHISGTGAASFPQSTLKGSQYARLKAIDGQDFPNDRWVCMGMTYDTKRGEVSAWLNGEQTAQTYADSVMQDVTGIKVKEAINPAPFSWPIYGSRAFVLKFNGYHRSAGGIGEHAIYLDLNKEAARYERITDANQVITTPFQIRLDVQRKGQSLLSRPHVWDVTAPAATTVPGISAARIGDVVMASLWSQTDGAWAQIGKTVTRTLSEGAPFTLGRALGLGKEEKDHGSQLLMSGVAVFNRVLSVEEMRALHFSNTPKK